MINFKQRSCKKELLDGDHIPFNAIKQNMKELDVINHRLGGHRITIKGLHSLLKKKGFKYNSPLHVVEIGCGGGDNLRVIQQWAFQNKLSVQLTGIDINPECVAYAKSEAKNDDIQFICSDYKQVEFDVKPHIIFSSLFCHHFEDEALIDMLQWMQQNTSVGFFINDLHRHPLAYHSIKVLTTLLSNSYLVKNDAPLSVLRSFVKQDWDRLFQKAGISNYQCQWQWAFRWLVTFVH
jgi:2-polyprenyl-3-methyl-5-hydroxy-6-metoxy-1,4-benzoquinol methylase